MKRVIQVCVLMAVSVGSGAQEVDLAQVMAAQAAAGGLSASSAGGSTTLSPGAAESSRRADRAAPVVTRTLPPVPPRSADQFEQLASTLAGQSLRYFGTEFFNSARNGGLPRELPAASDYVLGPGDGLSVRIWGQLDADLDLTVDASGEIFIPKVGNVRVNGLPLMQAEGVIRAAVGRLYRNFNVSVDAGGVRQIPVTVVGQVQQPGVHELSSNDTVLTALLLAGGPTADGSLRRVLIRRASGLERTVDLYQLLISGQRGSDARLQPGDVVVVPAAGTRVAVAGGVVRPGIYELMREQSLEDAIELAGGLRREADTAEVMLDRQRAGGRVGSELAGDRMASTRVRDGDVLVIPQQPARYDASVSLRGHVSQPRRLEWKEGLRVSDLVGSVDRLQTNDFWTNRELVGANRTQGIDDPLSRVSNARNINWDYATVERLDPATLGVELLSFNLRRAVVEKNERDNLMLQPGDIVTLYSTNDIRVPKEQRPRYVRLTGEVATPGIYRVQEGETLSELLIRIGGVTPDAFLFGTTLNRAEVAARQKQALQVFLDRQEQQIERQAAEASNAALSPDDIDRLKAEAEAQRRLLQKLRSATPQGRVVLGLKPTQRLRISQLPAVALEDGDSIDVPARPSTVSVQGEVFNPGDFLVRRADIGDYLAQSGGVTGSGDRAETFVLRADGTVVSRKQRRYLFGLVNRFNGLDALPGDAVFVPPQVDRTAFLRNLRDISQVLANFGLGAAAIRTLRD